ncbi:MAG: thioesterase family protein [Anaerolineae bacterium]
MITRRVENTLELADAMLDFAGAYRNSSETKRSEGMNQPLESSMPIAPEKYYYHTPMTIRYGDMDTLGHVNNAKYLTYIEQARISFFRDLQLWQGGIAEIGMIVAKISIDYKLPLTMDDGEVDIWTRCSRLGTKSFDLEQVVLRRDGATAASAVTVMVVYDYQANTSVALPDSWKPRLLASRP